MREAQGRNREAIRAVLTSYADRLDAETVREVQENLDDYNELGEAFSWLTYGLVRARVR